jgi:competence ComEA-like helix-hairpin-helix protein
MQNRIERGGHARLETQAMNFRTRTRLVLFLCWMCVAALAGAALAQKTPPAAPVDLNTATVAELQQLPGVGPAMANAIVQFRKKSGPFERLEDLLAIRGITTRKLAQLRPYLTVKSAARPSAK